MSDDVVNTDVASAILKGQLPESFRRRFAGQRLAITFITVGELDGAADPAYRAVGRPSARQAPRRANRP